MDAVTEPTVPHEQPAPATTDVEDITVSADRLIHQLGGWPELNELLRQNAIELLRGGGAAALQAAGIMQHQSQFTYRPDSLMANHIVRHFVSHHSGVRFTDHPGITWAVRGRPVIDGHAWTSYAVSLGRHSAMVGFEIRPRSAAAVLQAARDLDVERAAAMLIFLSRASFTRQSLGFSLPLAALGDIFNFRDDVGAVEALSELTPILSAAQNITLRLVRLPPGQWQFITLREEPAVRFYRRKADIVDVQLSEMLPVSLDNFMDVD